MAAQPPIGLKEGILATSITIADQATFGVDLNEFTDIKSNNFGYIIVTYTSDNKAYYSIFTYAKRTAFPKLLPGFDNGAVADNYVLKTDGPFISTMGASTIIVAQARLDNLSEAVSQLGLVYWIASDFNFNFSNPRFINLNAGTLTGSHYILSGVNSWVVVGSYGTNPPFYLSINKNNGTASSVVNIPLSEEGSNVIVTDVKNTETGRFYVVTTQNTRITIYQGGVSDLNPAGQATITWNPSPSIVTQNKQYTIGQITESRGKIEIRGNRMLCVWIARSIVYFSVASITLGSNLITWATWNNPSIVTPYPTDNIAIGNNRLNKVMLIIYNTFGNTVRYNVAYKMFNFTNAQWGPTVDFYGVQNSNDIRVSYSTNFWYVLISGPNNTGNMSTRINLITIPAYTTVSPAVP